MLSNFVNSYFGPLSKDYCVYFYALSIFFFSLFVISVILTLLSIIRKPSEINVKFIVKVFLILLYTFIPYLVNRLFYTMCNNSTF